MNNIIEKMRNYLMSKYTTKQNNSFANGIMIAGVIVNTVQIMRNPVGLDWINLLAIVLVAIGAVYQALFVRCPHCGDKLKGYKNKLPERCPECNGKLYELPRK